MNQALKSGLLSKNGLRRDLILDFFVAVLFLSICFFSLNIFAESQEEEKVVYKEVSGELSSVNSRFISLIDSKEKGRESEIILYIDEDVELVHLKDLEGLQLGDLIRIRYAEIEKDGSFKRIAQKINFIKPKESSSSFKSEERDSSSYYLRSDER